MKFQSTHPTLPVKFSLGGTDYSVSPGESVDIEECWVSRITARGLMLVPAVGDPPESVVEVLKVDPPVEATPEVAKVVAGAMADAMTSASAPRRGPGRPRNAATD